MDVSFRGGSFADAAIYLACIHISEKGVALIPKLEYLFTLVLVGPNVNNSKEKCKKVQTPHR